MSFVLQPYPHNLFCGYSVYSSPKKLILSFTCSRVVQNLNYFLLQITKYYILKNVDYIGQFWWPWAISQTIFNFHRRINDNFNFGMNYLFNIVRGKTRMCFILRINLKRSLWIPLSFVPSVFRSSALTPVVVLSHFLPTSDFAQCPPPPLPLVSIFSSPQDPSSPLLCCRALHTS